MMDSLGVDKAYQRLCHIQECFRARLSPKPWRIRIERPTFKFPCETIEQQRSMESWIARYEQSIGGHATCQFLETVGDGKVHPNVVKKFMNLHDYACRATSSLPLA